MEKLRFALSRGTCFNAWSKVFDLAGEVVCEKSVFEKKKSQLKKRFLDTTFGENNPELKLNNLISREEKRS